jgi:hypothetical protein
VINELPRTRSEPDPEPLGRRGVSHREIVWPDAGVRPPAARLSLPRWLDPLVLLLVLGYLLGGIAAAPFTLEEAVQLSLTSDAAAVATDPGSLLPGGASSAAQDAVRLGYGSFTRYTAAIGWYATGGRYGQAPIDLTVAGPGPVRTPSWHRLTAARTGPALLAVIAVLILYVLIRRMLGRAAALVGVLLFGLHPTIALVSRSAVDAGLTLTLGLAAVLVASAVSATLAAGDDPGLGAWTALAVLLGLTLASGATAPPYVAGAVSFCAAGLLGRQLRRRREVLAGRRVRTAEVGGGPGGWMAVSVLGVVLVWVLVSPALWGWLPERLSTRHDERATLVAERLLADPGPNTTQTRFRAAGGVLTDPFLTPPRVDHGVRLAEYQRSWWAGLPLGRSAGPGWLPHGLSGPLSVLVGAVLTLMAGIGVVGLWRVSRRQTAAITGWLLATAGWLVLWPSNQVDHGTPLVVLGCLLAAASVPVLLSWSGVRSSGTDQPGDDRRGHADQR